MSRHDEIKNAYKSLGGEATFYDGMITCSTLSGKAVCKLVWNMNKRKNDRYLELALSGIPQGFGGRTTALGLNIETLPTHIAGMPCAINISCHVTRHKTEVI